MKGQTVSVIIWTLKNDLSLLFTMQRELVKSVLLECLETKQPQYLYVRLPLDTRLLRHACDREQ